MGNYEDLTGQKFGRLKVIERAENDSKRQARWKCQCDCGNIKSIRTHSLVSGKTVSCGCYAKSIKKENSVKSNPKVRRLYQIWTGMKARCYNPNQAEYRNYGGRGITICPEWLNDFREFEKWSYKNGYEENLTIDRKDVNGNYEPSNCRWITLSDSKTIKETLFI